MYASRDYELVDFKSPQSALPRVGTLGIPVLFSIAVGRTKNHMGQGKSGESFKPYHSYLMKKNHGIRKSDMQTSDNTIAWTRIKPSLGLNCYNPI